MRKISLPTQPGKSPENGASPMPGLAAQIVRSPAEIGRPAMDSLTKSG
jgi:hypothetical protein